MQNIKACAEGKLSVVQMQRLEDRIQQMINLAYELGDKTEIAAWENIEHSFSAALVRSTQLYLQEQGIEVEIGEVLEDETPKGNSELVESEL